MELLANKLRPQKLEDVIGQTHLVGDGQILNNLVKNKKVFSCILYGKPGIGKTSIASALVNELELPHRFFNATINNKSDFDIVIEEAKMEGGMILVLDEIHRLNKDKQDLLLPYVENGLITLIGLTSSNPYNSINPAIRSRLHIFELHELSNEEIKKGLTKACNYLDNIKIDEDSFEYIIMLSGGDLRSALSMLELAYYSEESKVITVEEKKKINAKPVFYHDKNADGYYEVLSAFQKSIRGSDENAALHYLARLCEAEDLDSIARRLSVIAYEDIGLANPSVGPKVHAAIEAAKLVGFPEARIPLSVITIELALSPKSNSAYLALDAALNDIRSGNTGNVPSHIKNHNPAYKYPHDYKNSYVEQQYLPDKIKNKNYYQAKNNKYENSLKTYDKETRNKK